jgi:hypothetical protein
MVKATSILSANVFPMVLMISMFGSIFASPLLPTPWNTYIIPLTMFVMIGGMVIFQVYMQFVPRSYKHIHMTIRDLNGVSGEDQHCFIPASTDSLSVQPLPEDCFTTKKRKKPALALTENGNRKTFLLPEGIYPFIIRPINPLNFCKWQNISEYIVLSMKPFEDSFTFMPRKKAAMWKDSEVFTDHPASESATFYLLPYHHNVLGQIVPVLFLKECGGAWDEWDEKGGNSEWDSAKTGGEVATLISAIGALQEENVRLNLENKVYDQQVKGLEKLPEKLEEATYRQIEAAAKATGSIEGAYQHFRPTKGITALVAVGIIIAFLYFTVVSDPVKMAYLKAYMDAYWAPILIVAIALLGGVWYLNRRLGKHK